MTHSGTLEKMIGCVRHGARRGAGIETARREFLGVLVIVLADAIDVAPRAAGSALRERPRAAASAKARAARRACRSTQGRRGRLPLPGCRTATRSGALVDDADAPLAADPVGRDLHGPPFVSRLSLFLEAFGSFRGDGDRPCPAPLIAEDGPGKTSLPPLRRRDPLCAGASAPRRRRKESCFVLASMQNPWYLLFLMNSPVRRKGKRGAMEARVRAPHGQAAPDANGSTIFFAGSARKSLKRPKSDE